MSCLTASPTRRTAPTGTASRSTRRCSAPTPVRRATSRAWSPAEHATPLVLSVTIAATPENASYTNVAQVFSVTDDPNPDNDVSRATVAVSPTPIPVPPDPESRWTHGPEPAGRSRRTRTRRSIPTDPNTPGRSDGPGQAGGHRPEAGGAAADPGPDRAGQADGRPARWDRRPTRSRRSPPQCSAGHCAATPARWRSRSTAAGSRWATCPTARSATTSEGKVIVTATYPGPVLVKVTFSAPTTPGYTAFTQVKRYVVVPR